MFKMFRKRKEFQVPIIGTADRMKMISSAFHGISAGQKISLIYHVLNLLTHEEKKHLVQTIDRDLWSQMKP